MKKFILSIAAALTLLLSTAPAVNAASWSSVTVSDIQPCQATSDGGCGSVVLVWLSAQSSGTTCASDRTRVAVDLATPSGLYAASIFQSAFLSHATIAAITGTGSCTLFGGYENLYSFQE